MKKIRDLYNEMMPIGGFYPDDSNDTFSKELKCYTLSPENGSGHFWVYLYENMFDITIQDFVFNKEFFLDCEEPQFLSVHYYTSVSGEELHPYCQLSPNSLKANIGHGNGRIYQAIYHENVPIQSVGFSIMPEFYQQYLRDRFPGEYIDPSEAFRKMALGTDFPELVALLKQIQGFHGSGLTAKMFYEGKILEAVSLIIEKAKANQKKKKKLHITEQDRENLSAVATYIDNHYSFSLSIEQLCRIAFMGQTKLKSSFKELFGCTIFEYILQKRIGQAQHLLLGTDLSIAEISHAVGYERPENFAKQFQKTTGLLPNEYKKMTQRR